MKKPKNMLSIPQAVFSKMACMDFGTKGKNFIKPISVIFGKTMSFTRNEKIQINPLTYPIISKFKAFGLMITITDLIVNSHSFKLN